VRRIRSYTGFGPLSLVATVAGRQRLKHPPGIPRRSVSCRRAKNPWGHRQGSRGTFVSVRQIPRRIRGINHRLDRTRPRPGRALQRGAQLQWGSHPSLSIEGPSRSTGFVVGLLVLLMVWPDLSEAGIGGIVTLKRRVEKSEREIEKQDRKADALEERLLMLTNISSQVTSNSFSFGQPDLLPHFNELKDRSDRLEAQLARLGAAPSHEVDASPQRSREKMIVDLLANWEYLDEALGYSAQRRLRGRSVYYPQPFEEFVSEFPSEIELVRQSRNSVAHSRPITDADLLSAVEMSDNLILLLKEFPRSR
jgi:hypothetical protein